MPGNTRSFLPMSTLNAILLASYGLFTIPEGFSVCCFLVVELVSWGWGGWWKQHTMESDFLYAVGGGGSVGWGRRWGGWWREKVGRMVGGESGREGGGRRWGGWWREMVEGEGGGEGGRKCYGHINS